MSESETRLELRFFGQVQGVGFRWRAYHAANALGLTGWVRNMPDGSVLCEVQGDRSAIDEMLARVASGTYVDITRTDVKKLPLCDNERSFGIHE